MQPTIVQTTVKTKRIAFFKFPDDNPELKKTWIDNLRLENFVHKKSKRLCKQHVKNECFEKDPDLLKELGLKFKLLLKPDAVPTKFDRGEPKTQCQVKGKTAYKRAKFKKKVGSITASGKSAIVLSLEKY